MSQALSQLAESVGASERTLRRACLLGTIHAERLSPHRLKLSRTEHAYVARNWPVLGRLRAALRTEPNVSMAVLFGSVARGESDILSDVDLLIALRS
jgi:Polymerase beta, Nucleotidyltransferase